MATIYRFVIEQKATGRGSGDYAKSGRPRANKGAAKKGGDMPLLDFFGGSKGGVEHNRKMRAINPILNRLTGGIWEKSTRLMRAITGLVKYDSKAKDFRVSGTAIAIIIQLAIMTIIKYLGKYNQSQLQLADKQNADNFKKMENGVGGIHGSYKLMVNGWSGRITYNENK